MATSSCLISTVPNGVVPTIASLVGIDVSTVPENATVNVLGANAVGDGGGGSFYFSAGSAAGVNGMDVFATNSTGRWLRASTFSGVAAPPASASTYSGAKETFVVISGASPGFTVNYYFPPAATMVGKGQLTIKTITTGAVTLWPTGVDHIFDTAIQTSLTSSLITGQTWTFQAVPGRWYRTDQKNTI